MSEEQPTQPAQPPPPPPSNAPQQTAPVEPPTPPPADFGTQDSYAGDQSAPLNFGEQTFIRSGLPGELQTRVREPDAKK